ncbi:hypothetical protein FRC02_000327 [Tulasnella sp. 418]|nr:hypothetical protein FRC02_000327 [Tulasnella sp. 418]
MSFSENAPSPDENDPIVGNSTAIEWAINGVENLYRISLLLKPTLDVAVNLNSDFEGKELVFLDDSKRATRVLARDYSAPTNQHMMWRFVRDPSDEPPSYHINAFVGPIPSGLYWLGQAEIRTKAAGVAATHPSAGALTVNARFPLENQSTASLNLVPISDGPWPHQMWTIESGRRGYRLKNVGTNSYLTLHNREAVVEANSPGASPSEWCIKVFPKRNPGDIDSYT